MFIDGPLPWNGFYSCSVYYGCSWKNSSLSLLSCLENNLVGDEKSTLVGNSDTLN